MTAYYVRQDGTAPAKAAATDPITAAGAMSVAVHNAETFAPGDVIYLSSRGGDLTSRIIPPSSGGAGNPIEYREESVYSPDLKDGLIVNNGNYIDLYGLRSESATVSNFEFAGTTANVNTYDLYGRNSDNQALQHTEIASVVHHRANLADAADEVISFHDTATAVFYDSTIRGGANNGCINYVNGPTMSYHRCTFTALDNKPIIWLSGPAATILFDDCVLYGGANLPWGEFGVSSDGITFTMLGCRIHEGSAITGRGSDISGLTNATFLWEHCLFTGSSLGDYGFLLRSAVGTTYTFQHCTFADGVNTGALIYQEAGAATTIKNCCFCDQANQSLSGVTGLTADFNAFYNAGTARGTNTITDDPLLNSHHTPRLGSPLIGAGTPLTMKAARDCYQNPRKPTWDVGAAIYAIPRHLERGMSQITLAPRVMGAAAAADSSGGGNTATLFGGGERRSWQNLGGVPYGAWKGTGANYLNCGAKTLTGQGARAISCWLKRAAIGATNEYLVSEISSASSRGTNLYLYQGLPRFLIAGGGTYIVTCNDTTSICDDVLHHLVVTWDGTTDADTAIMYVDGTLVETATATAVSQGGVSTYNTIIGARATTKLEQFQGFLADVRMWNTAGLSAADVAILFAGGDTVTPPNVWYKLNDGR